MGHFWQFYVDVNNQHFLMIKCNHFKSENKQVPLFFMAPLYNLYRATTDQTLPALPALLFPAHPGWPEQKMIGHINPHDTEQCLHFKFWPERHIPATTYPAYHLKNALHTLAPMFCSRAVLFHIWFFMGQWVHPRADLLFLSICHSGLYEALGWKLVHCCSCIVLYNH